MNHTIQFPDFHENQITREPIISVAREKVIFFDQMSLNNGPLNGALWLHKINGRIPLKKGSLCSVHAFSDNQPEFQDLQSQTFVAIHSYLQDFLLHQMPVMHQKPVTPKLPNFSLQKLVQVQVPTTYLEMESTATTQRQLCLWLCLRNLPVVTLQP